MAIVLEPISAEVVDPPTNCCEFVDRKDIEYDKVVVEKSDVDEAAAVVPTEVEKVLPEPKKRGRPRKVLTDVPKSEEKPKRKRPPSRNVKSNILSDNSPEEIENIPTETSLPDIDLRRYLMDTLINQQRNQLTQRRNGWRELVKAKL